MDFFIVDTFTDKPFKGNPAAVVILNTDISKDTKQNLAKEIGFSETAFVKIKDEISIEYFTPINEIDLCGHATIATLHVLKENKFINGKT